MAYPFGIGSEPQAHAPVRKLLNRLLYPVGYRIERLSRFRFQLDLLLNSRPHFKFIQIGANDGVRFDMLYSIVTTHPCSGVVVEPLQDMYQRLQANYADYPAIVPIRKAIHASSAPLPLYRLVPSAVGRYAGWASGIASFDRQHLLSHGIAAEDIITEQVECLSLMTLVEQTGMLDADLLQIDTEGYDAAILAMIDFQKFRPRLIKYEHKNMLAAEHAATADNLRKNGYHSALEGTDTIAWL